MSLTLRDPMTSHYLRLLCSCCCAPPPPSGPGSRWRRLPDRGQAEQDQRPLVVRQEQWLVRPLAQHQPDAAARGPVLVGQCGPPVRPLHPHHQVCVLLNFSPQTSSSTATPQGWRPGYQASGTPASPSSGLTRAWGASQHTSLPLWRKYCHRFTIIYVR